MRRFLHHLLQAITRRAAAPRARTASCARPAVEALEDRAVPSRFPTGFFGTPRLYPQDFQINPIPPPSSPPVTSLMGQNLVLWDATQSNPRSSGSNPDGSLHIDSFQFDPSQNLYVFSGTYFNNWAGHRLAHTVPVTGTYAGPDAVDSLHPDILRNFHFSGSVCPVPNPYTGQMEVEDIEYEGNISWNPHSGYYHTDGVFKDYRHDYGTPSGPSIETIGSTIPPGSIFNLETGIFSP